jgi:hypothetical protein
MSSILLNIRSKYSLKELFDYLPVNLSFKLIHRNKKLSNNLDISLEAYKKYKKIKRILKPSYNLKKYFNYLDINYSCNNEDQAINEKVIYTCLNNASFNHDLIIENNDWEFDIKNLQKNNLIISPNLIDYLFNLDNDNKIDVFNILNIYRNNIVKISICYFVESRKLNFDSINRILEILKAIFGDGQNKITKISFENNMMNSYIDIIGKFFDKIDNIISFQKIEEILIDISLFNDYQFSDVFKYFSQKMTSLKNLKISGGNFSQNNFYDLNLFLTNPNERIDKIDFSACFCTSTITSVLYSKKFPLTSLKIKMFSKNNNWIFLDKNKDYLEELELEINGNENKFNKDSNELVLTLNKMKKLKKLKIIGGFSLKNLMDFYNYSNIEYFHVELDDLSKNDSQIYAPSNYFFDFKKLKSLTFGKKDKIDDFFEFQFSFPPNLNCLNLKNIKGKTIISLLSENIDNLAALEEFKLEKCHFDSKDLDNLLNLTGNFKSLLRLSINEIGMHISHFYKTIPNIIKNIPSLIELDISRNYYKEKYLTGYIFKNIKLSIPKSLSSLKIFHPEIAITKQTFDYLIETFGFVLDFENNYPKISQKEINEDLDFLKIFFLPEFGSDSDEDFNDIYDFFIDDDD